MKTAIKLASISLITASIAQSAQDPRFQGGNANPNNGLGQSILFDPTIGDKILEDDIARTRKLSLLEEVERIEKLSLKEYEDRLIEETKIKSEKIAHKNDLSEMEELLLNITLADSIEEEKRKKQIEEDELFALQNNFGGNLEQSFYGDDFLLAMQLSMQENLAKQPIEVKVPEIPDIDIYTLLFRATNFLCELRKEIENDYPEYLVILRKIQEEEGALSEFESKAPYEEQEEDSEIELAMHIFYRIRIGEIEKVLVELNKTKNKMNESLKITESIDRRFNDINKVSKLMAEFDINEKNAKEILTKLDL